MDIIKSKRIVTSFFNNTLGLPPDVLESTNECFNLCAGAKFDDFYCGTLITIGYDVKGLLQISVILGKITKPTFDIYTLINEYNGSTNPETNGFCFKTFIQDNQLIMNTVMPLITPNHLNQYLDLLLSNLKLSLSKNPIMKELCGYIIEE